MRERRRFPRYDAAMDMEYMKVAGLASIRSSTATKNVSRGGVCACMSRLVGKGNEVIIRLSLSPFRSLTVLARIRWVVDDSVSGRKRCGLEFRWVSSKPLLSEYVGLAGKMEAA